MAGIIIGNKNNWKRYYLQSGASIINYLKNNSSVTNNNLEKEFSKIKKIYNAKELNFEQRKFDYSWIITSNKKIKTFKDACNLFDPIAYDDYKFLSNFSHSASLYFKNVKNEYSFYNNITIHYIYLNKIIKLLHLNNNQNYIKNYNNINNYFIKLINSKYY